MTVGVYNICCPHTQCFNFNFTERQEEKLKNNNRDLSMVREMYFVVIQIKQANALCIPTSFPI